MSSACAPGGAVHDEKGPAHGAELATGFAVHVYARQVFVSASNYTLQSSGT